ncbi:hypothetical protein [Fibrella arboris]|uniref:hypothetical protein n=1 Tax=Fibrella arboris TaxID=3242486 RepID=UPI003521DEEC
MLDGFKSFCRNQDPANWLNAPALASDGFTITSNGKTGEVSGQSAKYNDLTFTVTPSVGGLSRCMVSGSLHKYHNANHSNANRFTLADLQAAILDLENKFGIDASTATLENLEIGVNLHLPYSPQRVIRAASACRHRPFVHTQEPDSRPGIGKVAGFCEYVVKLYDKGKQTGNPAANLLRVEMKFKKMRPLHRYNVRTLADLTNPANVGPLVEVLLSALADTMFLDTSARLDQLTDREQADFRRFRDSDTWEHEEIKPYQRQDYRQRIARILKKCNAFDYASDLQKRVANEWQILTDGAAQRPAVTPKSGVSEAHEKATFSPLDCLGENVASDTLRKEEKEKDIDNPKGTPVRLCVSCGKPLTNQKAYSFFCSEKYNGPKAARTCRNRDSNQRRTKRNQIMKAQQRNQFLRITYSVDGETYTDTLHSSEVSVSRADLDKVESIFILPACLTADHSGRDCYAHCRSATPENLTGPDARALLADLTSQNAPPVEVDLNGVYIPFKSLDCSENYAPRPLSAKETV